MDLLRVQESLPVAAECDLLVCGGGCSGITAAVAAARHGVRVVLLERWPSVGGMATNALVNGWHRSDREEMVIYGLVEESAQRAERHGWIRRDPAYPHAHETHWFDPEGMRIVWQRMLDEAGVRTFCYLTAGEPLVEGGRLRGVLADTKRGRQAFLGQIVIDATGDGDIFAKANVPHNLGRPEDGRVQGMTEIFALRGVDDSEEARARRAEQCEAVLARMRELAARGEFPPFNEGNTRHYLGGRALNHVGWNMLPVAGDPLDEEELSRLTALARERLVSYLEFWRENVPGMAEAVIEQTAFTLGVRESRRLRGRKTLDREMVLNAVKQPDALGHGVWMIDIHDPLGSGYTTYTDRDDRSMLAAGTSYHLPLGMCLTHEIPNLAVVGRCASATHEALASCRVQTHCMVLGQGVGTAAALALDSGRDLAQVSLPDLHARLRADGVYLEEVP
ncbi:MAG: FAD-dependent oxidoreductase [candidate division WS1 bacterium]|nr:FAD-dependent oxidoreductase [candidate division WS1 bacterium]